MAAFRATAAPLMRFRLKSFHGARSTLTRARLQSASRTRPDPLWLSVAEAFPPRPPPPTRRVQGRKLPLVKAPGSLLSEKVLRTMQATQDGRELMRGFGGQESFVRTFVGRQMERIRAGESEADAFAGVREDLQAELNEYKTKISEAYANVVGSKEEGMTLSEFIAQNMPEHQWLKTLEDATIITVPPSRFGPTDWAFVKALAELGIAELPPKASASETRNAAFKGSWRGAPQPRWPQKGQIQPRQPRKRKF